MPSTKDDNSGYFEDDLADIHEVPPSLDSPVNLDIREATILKLPKLSWLNYEKPPKKMKITNTGQTVVLSGKWFSERPHLRGGALKSKYVFSQIHFHWGGDPKRGSEHTVDNYRMPLEMHLVHFKAEYGSQDNALQKDDGLFVIGCFFKPEDNPAMSSLTDKLEYITRPHTSHNVTLSPIATLITEFDGDYFSYWGSMCSDNCQHTILWCFPRTLVGISRQQILKFQCLVNDEGLPLRMDEHSVQPLGSRRMFLVNPSYTMLSTTLPGMEASFGGVYSTRNSEEIFSSRSSIELLKLALSDDMFHKKTFSPAPGVGSALKLKTAKPTTDLATSKPAKEPVIGVSPTPSIKSTKKTTGLATSKPAKEPVTGIIPMPSIKFAKQTKSLATSKPAKEPVSGISPTPSIKFAKQTTGLATSKPAKEPVTGISPTPSIKFAKQTTGLATSKPVKDPVTDVTKKSAGKRNAGAADVSETSAPPVDVPDFRGQENKNLRDTVAGNTDGNDNLFQHGDLLETPAPQNATEEKVNKNDNEKLMPKTGSFEEILQTLEELRRNHSLYKDSFSDLGSPRTYTSAEESHFRESSKSAKRHLQEEKKAKRNRLRWPTTFAKKPEVAPLPVAKTGTTAASAAKARSKEMSKQQRAQRTLPSAPTANQTISEKPEKPLKARSRSVGSSHFLDVSSGKVTSVNSQTSFYLSSYEDHDSLRIPFTDSSSLKSSNYSDRGTLFDRKSLVVKPERYVSAQSPPFSSKSGTGKTLDSSNTTFDGKSLAVGQERCVSAQSSPYTRKSGTGKTLDSSNTTFDGKSLAVKPERYVSAQSSPYTRKSGTGKTLDSSNTTFDGKSLAVEPERYVSAQSSPYTRKSGTGKTLDSSNTTFDGKSLAVEPESYVSAQSSPYTRKSGTGKTLDSSNTTFDGKSLAVEPERYVSAQSSPYTRKSGTGKTLDSSNTTFDGKSLAVEPERYVSAQSSPYTRKSGTGKTLDSSNTSFDGKSLVVEPERCVSAQSSPYTKKSGTGKTLDSSNTTFDGKSLAVEPERCVSAQSSPYTRKSGTGKTLDSSNTTFDGKSLAVEPESYVSAQSSPYTRKSGTGKTLDSSNTTFDGKSLAVEPESYVSAQSSPYTIKSGTGMSLHSSDWALKSDSTLKSDNTLKSDSTLKFDSTLKSEIRLKSESTLKSDSTLKSESTLKFDSALKAKAAGIASVTVSLAGCWKKPSVIKVAVAPTTVFVVETKEQNIEEEVPFKSRESSYDVRSMLEKLEREVSATLRQDKAGDFYLAKRAEGRELECRNLVQPTESIPSILGDEDSYASLIHSDGDEIDSRMTPFNSLGLNFARNDGKIYWGKKPSSYNTRLLPNEVVRWPMDKEEWRAKRTDALLREATALLKEHHYAMANMLDIKIKLPSSHTEDSVEEFS